MDRLLVYVGTYTGPNSKGIYRFQFDLATGALTADGVAAEAINPSFLALHPNHRFLYAANEISSFQGKKTGAVSAFALDAHTGELKFLNQKSSEGDGPCFVAVDHAGKNLLVANYGGGSLSTLPISANGHLEAARSMIQHLGTGANPARQEGPHAHSIYPDATDHFVLACDLGLDKVFVYHWDPGKSKLSPNEPPYGSTAPGAGPRHLAFGPGQKVVYVVNEVNSTVTAFRYDAQHGTLEETQTLSTLPDDFHGSNTTAEIAVHPSGKFLYVSNRGDDSIVIYRLDPDTGKMAWAGRQSTLGKTPRNFAIDPTGAYLLAANQESNTIVVFRIDAETGLLTEVGQPVEAPAPVAIVMLAPAR